MATSRTVTLGHRTGGIPQAATLTWTAGSGGNPGTVAVTFNPPLPANDTGPVTITRVGPPRRSEDNARGVQITSGWVRNYWARGGPPSTFDMPNPGEVIREYSSLSDSEWSNLKMAEIALRVENSDLTQYPVSPGAYRADDLGSIDGGAVGGGLTHLSQCAQNLKRPLETHYR